MINSKDMRILNRKSVTSEASDPHMYARVLDQATQNFRLNSNQRLTLDVTLVMILVGGILLGLGFLNSVLL